MHTLRAATLKGLILSGKSFTRLFVKNLSSKRSADFSWFLVDPVLLIIVLLRTIFRKREITKSQISREQFIFKNFLHTVLKILSAQIRINIFLFKNFFSRTWSFSHNFKTTNLVSFFTQKFNFTLFFKYDYLILTQY